MVDSALGPLFSSLICATAHDSNPTREYHLRGAWQLFHPFLCSQQAPFRKERCPAFNCIPARQCTRHAPTDKLRASRSCFIRRDTEKAMRSSQPTKLEEKVKTPWASRAALAAFVLSDKKNILCPVPINTRQIPGATYSTERKTTGRQKCLTRTSLAKSTHSVEKQAKTVRPGVAAPPLDFAAVKKGVDVPYTR